MYRKKTASLLAGWLFGFVLSLQAQPHPKLIVVLVVDQMRADYLDRFASYERGGLHFLATQGANFLNANFEHLPTETCPGHAVLLSGRNPVHTGIVANDWYDRDSGKSIYCVADANSAVIGDSGTPVSPRNFLGENFSDWLQTSYPGARVFSISLKDRAAILLGGHHPQGVFWFSHETGRFITSRYYADRLPGWVEEFNSKRVPDSYRGKEWTPVMGDSSPAYHTHDRTLGHLVESLSARLGKENVLWVLSADHGAEPTPEAELELDHNRSAQRIPFSDALNSVEKQLNAIFSITGEMHWFAGQADSMLYFDRAELTRHGIALAAARLALVKQVHDVPGVAGFYDTSRLASVPGWVGRFLRNSTSASRSGDIYYLTKEWTLFSSKPTGTSHGDPWPYDTHVPLVIAGWGIQPQRIKRNVQIVDLAPTLADLIGAHWPRSEALDGQSRKNWLRFRAHTGLK